MLVRSGRRRTSSPGMVSSAVTSTVAAARALPEDLTDQGHRRAREEAAPGGDEVAVLHARDRVLDGGELLAGRFRFGFEPAARFAKVVWRGRAWHQASTSQPRW